MTMYELIDKKKNGEALTKKELYYIVKGYTDGNIPDYQMSAFLMAVCLMGMTREETYYFTMAMRESGDELDLSGVKGMVVDKHSTGGVGDKVSLVIGPMVAACGVPVAKMSGRGLGHTGGTIDKLESFSGFNVSPSEEEFIRNVNEIGISWAGQTANLAPADKKIYALRDVTATVDSIPLIASSIMSKKLASGAGGIVLDVTYGSGAFMKNTKDAIELAELMLDIGNKEGRKMSAVITDMEEPLGFAVGNSIEVTEAIDCLNGNGPEDVMEVAYTLGSHMLVLNGKCKETGSAREMLENTIASGMAIKKMAQWIERQGGNKAMVYDTTLFKKAKIEREIKYTGENQAFSAMENNLKPAYISDACTQLYVSSINGKAIGIAVQLLGGGRSTKDEKIDLSVGVRLLKKAGDTIKKQEPFAVIYANNEKKCDLAENIIREAFGISDKKIQKRKKIFREIF